LVLFDEQTRGREQKIRKPATLQESPVALHSTQSAMGLLHTITAAYMITASEASRCVTGQSKHWHGPKSCGTKSYGRGNIQLNLRKKTETP